MLEDSRPTKNKVRCRYGGLIFEKPWLVNHVVWVSARYKRVPIGTWF